MKPKEFLKQLILEIEINYEKQFVAHNKKKFPKLSDDELSKKAREHMQKTSVVEGFLYQLASEMASVVYRAQTPEQHKKLFEWDGDS